MFKKRPNYIIILLFFLASSPVLGQEHLQKEKLAGLIGDGDMAADLTEALSFTKYPTYSQYDSMMHYFADSYPDLCIIDTIGTSLEGRLLLALKLSDNPTVNEAEPRFMYSATMHGNELIGYVLMLRLIDFLLDNYESNIEVERLLNAAEIWINPLANPDGTFRNGDHTIVGSTRENAVGEDLNRNYPYINMGRTDDTTGLPHENKSMMEFLRKHRFNLSANIHAGEEVVNYPWDFTPQRHPDDDWWIHVSREYADLAHDVQAFYLDGFEDGITNGWDWYYVYGSRQDYVNFFLNGRELTLELSISKLLSSSSLNTFWTYNQWSLLNYMQQSTYGIHGIVSDLKTGDPLAAKIFVLNHDENMARLYIENTAYRWANTDTLEPSEYQEAPQLGSWVLSDSTHGDFYRYLKEGTYDLQISAEGYVTDTLYDVEVVDFEKTEVSAALVPLVPTVPEQMTGVTFRIYPNPVTTYATIVATESMAEDCYLLLYDFHGKLLHSQTWNKGQLLQTIDMNALPTGIYFLRINDQNSSKSFKLIKMME